MKLHTKLKLTSLLTLSATLLCCIIVGICGIFGGQSVKNTDYADAYVDSTEIVLDDGSGGFANAGFKQLMRKISNSTTMSSYIELDNVFDDLSAERKDARLATTVTFAGLKWNVVYVSRTAADGTVGKKDDLVATLWLADTTTATAGVDTSSGYYFSPGGYSQYTTSIKTSSGISYPTNMYSSSYIRAQLNGTKYAYYGYSLGNQTSIGSGNRVSISSGTSVQKSTWKNLIANYGSYISTPSQMGWQQTQRAGTANSTGYTWGALAADCPSSGLDATGGKWANAYASNETMNYSTFGNSSDGTNYTAWGNDKIWLPSVEEAGYDDSSHIGIWHTTAAQRSFTSGSYQYYRSGYCSYSYLACVGGSNGSYKGRDCYVEGCVRPAIHLNLKLAADAAGALISIQIAEPTATTATLTYNGNAQTLITAGYDSAKMSMSVSYKNIAGTTSTPTAATSYTNAGTYTYTFTPKTGYCWTGGSTSAVTKTVTINQASPTASASVASGTYYAGDALSTVGISLGSGSTAGTIKWTTSTTALSNGTASYGWTFTPTDTNNYKSATGTASVTAVPKVTSLTVTGAKTSYTAYDAFSTSGMTVTANYAGGVASKAVTNYTFSYPRAGASSFLVEDSGKAVTISYTESGKTVTATVTVTVAKKNYDMTGVTFANKTVTYTAAEQSLTVSGTLPSGLSVTGYTYDGATATGKTSVGSYTVKPVFSSTDSANYNLPSMSATLKIDKADLQLQWAGTTTAVYGGSSVAAHIETYILFAPVGDLDTLRAEYAKISIKYTGTRTNGDSYDSATVPVNAGTYKPSVVSYPTGILDNYSITIVNDSSYSIEITRQSFTPVFNGSTRVFDNKAHTISVSSGLPADGQVTVAYTVDGAAFAGATNVGTYAVVATFSCTSGNYVLPEPITATLKITPADISSAVISGINSSYIYTGAAIHPAISSVVINLAGEDVSLGSNDYEVSYAVTNDRYYAGEVVTVTITGKGNYESTKSVAFSIARATLTVEWTAGEYVYNGSGQAPSYEVDGVKGSDSIVPTVTYVGVDGTSYNSASKPVNAGKYKVVVHAVSDPNYNVLNEEKQFEIAKADLVVKVTFDLGGRTSFYEGEALPDIILVSATFNGADVAGVLGWSLVDGKVPAIVNGSHSYGWEFVPEDTVNFNVYKSSQSLIGQAASISKIVAALRPDAPKIFTSTSLTTLRSYIIATATLSNGTEINYSGYVLSGAWGAGEYAPAAGTYTLTLTCPNGESCTLDVEFVAVALEKLEVDFDAVTAGTLFEGAKLDDLKQYLTVTAVYNDVLKNTVLGAGEYSLTADCGQTLTSGRHTVTVSYTNDEFGTVRATFNIDVERFTVTGISVKLADGALVYSTTTEAELLRALEVTATYSDNTTAQISGFTVAHGELVAGSTVVVTVTYGEHTATCNVFVQQVTLTGVTAAWDGAQPVVYPSTDVNALKDSLIVTAHYDSVDDAVITDYVISGDLTAAGTAVVTISYGGKECKISVNVSAFPAGETLQKIEANFNQGSLKIFESDDINLLKDLLEVKAYYGVNGGSLTEKTVQGDAYALSVEGGKFVVGENVVTVTYDGKEDTFTVVVSSVDPGAIYVEWVGGAQPVIYNDATLEDLYSLISVLGSKNGRPVDDYVLSGVLSAGVSVITVTSGELSTTFNVTVTAIVVTGLEVSGDDKLGEIYASTDINTFKEVITVYAVYNNGDKVLVNSYALSGVLVAGESCDITVSYNGATATFSVNVSDKRITGLKVTYIQGSTPVYSYNTLAELTTGGRGALTVIAVFSDGEEVALSAGDYALSGALTSGECVVTVAYNGVSEVFTVKVTEVSLVSISATYTGGDVFEGSALDELRAGLNVVALYGDTHTKVLGSGDYELSGSLVVGENTITITYGGVSTTFTVYAVPNKVESIYAEYSGAAVYESDGLEFLRDNLTVYATYTDGSVVEVTSYVLSGELVAGTDCVIGVVYNGKTANFTVTVESEKLDVTEVGLDVYFNGAQPTVHPYDDVEGLRSSLVVRVKLSDGTYLAVTGYAISGDLVAPSSTITITYNGKSATIEVNVTEDASVVLTGITAVYAQGAEKLFEGVTVADIKTKLEVVAEYSNGVKKNVVSGYEVTGALGVGVNVLTVTYGGESATFKVVVSEVALESIVAVFDAAAVGDITLATTLDELRAGLKVSGYKNNGKFVENITDYELSGDISAVGNNTITVISGNVKTTFVVVASGDVALTGVSLAVDFGDDEVYASVTAEGLRKYLTVTAQYGSSSKRVTDFTINYANGKVSVTYGGLTSNEVALDLTPVALDKIFASFNATRTIFTSTDLNELKSMITLSGVNNDGSVAGVLSGEYDIIGTLKAGKTQLTVEYGGLYATFTVDVTAVKVVSLTVEVNTLPTVFASTDIDSLKNYITVYAHYNDGSVSAALPASEYALSGVLVAGRTCTVTATYNGATGDFVVEVNARTIDRITAAYTEGNRVIYSSDGLDVLRENLVVNVYYTDAKNTPVLLTEGYELSGDLVAGSSRITVRYNGKEDYFNVTVTAVELVALSVEADNLPEIFMTTSLNSIKDYLTVTAKYGNGETKEVPAENYALEAEGGLKIGENVLVITYGGKTCELKVTVSGANLTGIYAETTGSHKIYATTALEALKEWIAVTATYSDGRQAAVYDYEISGALVAGQFVTLTITYGGASTTLDVFVEAKTLDKITAEYSGAEVTADTPLNALKQNLVVKAYFNGDEEGVELGADEYSLEGTLTAGTSVTVTAVYGSASAAFEVTVKAQPQLSAISAAFSQGNVKVYATDDLDSLKNMLTVTAYYKDANGFAAGDKVLEAGEYTLTGTLSSGVITVNYNGVTATFSVTVTPVALSTLKATFDANKVGTITAATHFDALNSGLTVTGTNNNGTPYNGGNAITGYDITGDLVAGEICTLTVTYNGVSTTFEVSVAADVTLTGITVQWDNAGNAQDLTVYANSDIAELVSHIQVRANYTGGAYRIIKYPNYEFVTKSFTGTSCTVTLSYHGMQSSITVEVTPKALAEIFASFNQSGKPIYSGDSLETLISSGAVSLTVTGIYNDGDFEPAVTGYTLEYDFSVNGKVTVKYGDLEAEFTVVIISDSLQSISVSFTQGPDDVIYESQGVDAIRQNLLYVTAYTTSSHYKVDNADVTLTVKNSVDNGDTITYTVGVSYFGVESDRDITVIITKLKLESIEVDFNESAFDASGTIIYDSTSAEDAFAKISGFVKVSGHYNDGSDQPLNVGDLVASGSLATATGGKATITLTLSGTSLTDEISLTVTPVELQSIVATFRQTGSGAGLVFTTDTFESLKDKIFGSDANITLSVKAIFNNGTERELLESEYELIAASDGVDENGHLIKGTLAVTVRYTHGEKSAEDSFGVNVSNVNISSITASYVDTVYTTTTLDEFKSKLAVIAVYSDGEIERIPAYNCIIDYTATDFSGKAGTTVTVNISYNGKTASVSFTVAKAAVSIDLSGYDGYTYTFDDSLTVQELAKKAVLKAGLIALDAELNYSGLTFTAVPSDGIITITVSFDGNADFEAADTEMINIVVKKKAVDISGLKFELDGKTVYEDAASLVYDGNEHILDMTVALGGVTVAKTLTYGNGVSASEIRSAGEYKLEVTLTFDGNHANAAGGGDTVKLVFSLTVEKLELDLGEIKFAFDTLTFAEDYKTVYDGSHTAGIDGTLPDGVSAELTVNGGKDYLITKAGSYELRITFDYDSDYTGIPELSVTLTVEKAKPVINVDAIKAHSWIYTGEEQTVEATLDGDVASEGVQLIYRVDNVDYTDGYKFTNVPASGTIMMFIYTGETANYAVAEATLTIFVSKATLTATAPDVTITYGEVPEHDDLKLTVTGYLANDEAALALDLHAYTDYSLYGVVSGNGVSYRTIVPDVTLDNYIVDKVNGTLTVEKKSVTVVWEGLEVVYDGKAHLPTATFTDVAGNSVALKVELPEVDGSIAVDANSYRATLANLNVNYDYDAVTNTLIIKPATIEVTGTGDKWTFKANMDADALITLDEKDDNGEYKRIALSGNMVSDDVTVEYSSYAYTTTATSPEGDTSYTTVKPGMIFGNIAYGVGTYYVNYRITVANHTTLTGRWVIEILPENEEKIVEIIFNKQVELEYGAIPSTDAELRAFVEKLLDGYITVNGMDEASFLADMQVSLVVNNDTLVTGATAAGNYNIYFEFKDADKYAGWNVFYKGTDDKSDTNIGKLIIAKRELTVEWKNTEFVANGTVRLPAATISGFIDGKDYELVFANAQTTSFEIERDGRTLVVTATLSGDFTTAGAHTVTLEMSDGNYTLSAPTASVSLTAPKSVTVSLSSYFYFANGDVQLPEISVNVSGEITKFALTAEMISNGGGIIEVDLGDGKTAQFKVTLEGDFTSEGISRITVESQDEGFFVSTGEQNVTFTKAAVVAPVADEEKITPLTWGIIIALCVLAFGLIVVFIIALKRKPAAAAPYDDDGFGDDYVED